MITKTNLAVKRALAHVAIAGRPNVGKSTLFNRLLGMRRAITDPTAGLTRDPVTEEAVILGRRLLLTDTGGFRLEGPSEGDAGLLEQAVVDRALGVIEQADLVVLLLEAGNISGEDEEFIETLRAVREKLLVAVNKTEGGRKSAEAWNLLKYGFDEILMISAEHGDNIEDLKAAIIARLGPAAPSVPPLVEPEGGGSVTVNNLTNQLGGCPPRSSPAGFRYPPSEGPAPATPPPFSLKLLIEGGVAIPSEVNDYEEAAGDVASVQSEACDYEAAAGMPLGESAAHSAVWTEFGVTTTNSVKLKNPQGCGFLSRIRISLIGKPNSGKSTLTNRLTASTLSIVSPIPGTTRDVLRGDFTWKGRQFAVCDTAGIRRRSKVTDNIEYYSVNRAIKTMDAVDIVILLVDAQEGFSEQDKKIAALACERGRGIIFALNKWDAMGEVKNTFNAVCDKIRFFFGQMSWAPITAISALNGSGIDVLLDTCVKMYGQLNCRTGTGALNAALESWQTEHPPPMSSAGRFHIKYGVQTSANPVVFRLFVSRPAACKDAYLAYLQRKIRTSLGYSMIPIRLELKKSAGPGIGREKHEGRPRRSGHGNSGGRHGGKGGKGGTHGGKGRSR
ncbi:MAG: ribosome biogenesis GTPase Der [Spirochaetaceae bacterium]|jgi:ribosome-associated GTPase EngA|nr:ribosome biogenesis GTPase Der [Spirochaetaceae bacterium]